MFSSRLPWNAQPNRISEALRRRREQGGEVLDLTESNPTHAGLPYEPGEILAALTDERAISYEPSAAGAEEARAAVSEYYAGRGQRVEPSRMILTASTSESYGWLFKLLADPGDDVLVPRPSYPLFEFLAALESVRVVQYPLLYHEEWQIDFGALEPLMSERTKALVLVNPNNPTGSFLKEAEWTRLAALCRARGVAVICDEVFADFVFEGGEARVGSLADRHEVLTFSLSGLSKVCGLPQMKLGWMVISGPAEERRQALERVELIADTYLSVSSPVQLGAAKLLATRGGYQTALQRRLEENLGVLRTMVREHPAFRLLKVEGGWYATVRVPRIRTEEEWVLRLLGREGVLTQPGYFYDFESEAYLILSLMTPGEVFREGIRRLCRGENETW